MTLLDVAAGTGEIRLAVGESENRVAGVPTATTMATGHVADGWQAIEIVNSYRADYCRTGQTRSPSELSIGDLKGHVFLVVDSNRFELRGDCRSRLIDEMYKAVPTKTIVDDVRRVLMATYATHELAALDSLAVTSGLFADAESPAATPDSSVPEQLAAIRSAFGMSIVQLAKVLRVSRPTVYKWFLHDESKPIHHANLDRIGDIRRLADFWGTLCKWPVDSWLDREVGGRKLGGLLNRQTLDFGAIRATMRAVAPKVAAQWEKRQTKSMTAAMNKLGSTGQNPSDQADAFMTTVGSSSHD